MASTRFELVIVQEGQEPLVLPAEGEMTIGRDPECTVVMSDNGVSRRHCQLRCTGGQFVLRDLGSTFGTLVDDLPTTQLRLTGSETVRISPSTTFTLRRAGARESAPAHPVQRPVRPRRGRAVMHALKIACIWGIAAAAALGMWQVYQSRQVDADATAGFEATLRLARNHVSLGQYDEAETALEQALLRDPDGEFAARLRAAQENAQSLRQRRNEALGILQSMAMNPAFESRGEFESALHAARPTEPRVLVSEAAFAELLNHGRETYVRRAQARASAARVAAQEALAERRHGAALTILDLASEDPSLDEAGRLRLRSLRTRAESEAEAEHDALIPEIKAMQPALARRALNEVLPRFEGTRHEGALRALLGIIPESVVDDVAVDHPKTAEKIDYSSAAMDALAAAEGIAARRNHAEAAGAFALAAATATTTAGREHCERRRQRMEALQKLPALLAGALAENPARFRGISLGGDARGDLKGVNEQELVFQIGVGARQTIAWARLASERQALLLFAARFTGDAALIAVEWLLELREPARALDLLAGAAGRDPSLVAKAMPLVAECKGLSGVPLSGFELFAGTFMTSAERQRFVADRRLEECARTVETGEGMLWEVALDELRNAAAAGRTAALRALQLRRDRLVKDPAVLAGLVGSELQRTRLRLRKELDEARAHALELVMDEKRYPYPYGPDQAAVQGDVDNRIKRVEELWRNPSRRALELVPSAAEAWQRVDTCSRAIESLGTDADDAISFLEALDECLDIAHAAGDDDEGARLMRREELVQLSADLTEEMSGEERECHEATNAYRVMMGFDPVVPDVRLVKSARGHSEEMKKLGYFSHTSPTKGQENPGQRAKLAGWGSGVSENIAMGQATGVASVVSWRSSSGHHRNLLGNWTHLGCGKASSGAFWTQNFSRGPLPKFGARKTAAGPAATGGGAPGPRDAGSPERKPREEPTNPRRDDHRDRPEPRGRETPREPAPRDRERHD